MKTYEEIQREAQLAELRAKLGDAFADWAAKQDRMMDHNPVATQQPPDGYYRAAPQINPMPQWRARTIAGAQHPDLGTVTADAHDDLIRAFHVEPAVAAHKRKLDENRRKLAEDRAKWWGNSDG